MIRIISDSTCDLTQEQARILGIVLLPMHVRFGDNEYLDGINLSAEEFYSKLVETDVFPKTSQVTPYEYEEAIEREIDKGNDVLILTVSSKVSGCYQSAVYAASEYGDKVRVIDTESVSMGIQLLLYVAQDLIAQGKSLHEVGDILDQEKKRVRFVALLNTLEYLKKGGRLSSAKAAAGKLLGLKPVICQLEGEVAVLGTARGSKSGSNLLMKYTEENHIDLNMPFGLIYSGFSDALLQKYIRDSAHLYEGKNAEDFKISRLGACIGTYAGPDAIGAAYFASK